MPEYDNEVIDDLVRQAFTKGMLDPDSFCDVPKPNEGMDVLQEAHSLVNGERAKSYGPPEEHFGRTIGMFNSLFSSYLKKPLESHHWAQIMVLDKMARCLNDPDKRDNWVDTAGYSDRGYLCRVSKGMSNDARE